MRRAVESQGDDTERGIFIQTFDHPAMDAALLLLPMVGFVAYDDQRMIRTTDAVRAELCENGLLRRYLDRDDGMEGREGVFPACSFLAGGVPGAAGSAERNPRNCEEQRRQLQNLSDFRSPGFRFIGV